MIAPRIIFEDNDAPTIRRWGNDPLGGWPVLPPSGGYTAAKRALEFVVALVMLVLSSPFLLLAALLIKLTSRGAVVYSQTRLGLNGRPYTIYKLRSMTQDCEKVSGARWSNKGDARITPIGRFLRKTHLDELPQLWNVLRGDMSLVGPRPERPEFIPALERAIPGYRDRLLVRPGITGLAQVQLPADSDMASVRRKLAYDLYYVRSQTLLLDLQIVLSTGLKVLGLPFTASRVVFRLPSEVAVERSYEAVQTEAEPLPSKRSILLGTNN